MTTSQTDRAELLLRVSRRALIAVLGMVLLAAATFLAHALRPGSLLADWASRASWVFPIAAALIFGLVYRPLGRPLPPDAPEMRAMLSDEFRQANLGRAQRIALIVVMIAQMPMLGLALTGLTTAAAVTVMAVSTVTLGMSSLIISFLYLDRE